MQEESEPEIRRIGESLINGGSLREVQRNEVSDDGNLYGPDDYVPQLGPSGLFTGLVNGIGLLKRFECPLFAFFDHGVLPTWQ